MRVSKASVYTLSVLLTLAGVCTWLDDAAAAAGSAGDAAAKLREGVQALQSGRLEQAVPALRQAADLCRAGGAVNGQIDAMVSLAAAYQMLGQYDLAVQTLEAALPLADRAGDMSRKIAVLNSLGSALTLKPQEGMAAGAHAMHGGTAGSHDAMTILRQAMELAQRSGDARMTALVQNNLGNLYSSRREFAKAIEEYRQSAESAGKNSDPLLEAKALANAAVAAAAGARQAGSDVRSAGQLQRAAGEFNQRAYARAAALPASHEKAMVLLTIGQTDEEAAKARHEKVERLPERTGSAYDQAAAIARAIGDRRLLSYALGYSGHLAELRQDYPKAIDLTRRAVLEAQRVQSRDALYRWQWQTGRVLWRMGQADAAVAAYRRALDTLQAIRNDIILGNGNQRIRVTFRHDVAPVYYELADLLLRQADRVEGAAQITLLKEARDTIERLKSAELEDYFQDECTQLVKGKQKEIDSIGTNTAAVYLIPLPDRTEILVTFPSGLKRFKSPVGTAQLTAAAVEFRKQLVYVASDEYQISGRQLYDWLIRPIEPELQAEHIDTLVFVPDGVLRTIPMAALYDGQKHLVEKYAVAVTPGLTLMEPKAIHRERASLLISGLSEARRGYPALPFVPNELQRIQQVFKGTELINKSFVPQNLKREFSEERFSIVHIASHGHFGGDAKDTYVLTYSDPLTLDQVERLIRPAEFRGQPLELLTLSACQTAAGDDRAALGLAGIAIKAGARAALATLWCVNDEATSMLISDFYAQLRDNPTITKAKALQKAQLDMIHNPNPVFHHPYLWAPYLIIGNWL